jgi:DNA-binding transcriptional LysR family regulator
MEMAPKGVDGNDIDDTSNRGDSSSPKAYLQAPVTTLKQWVFFHAVVECGSFAAAAESLEVSQPTISYTIARLEEILDVALLRLDGRKSQLTDAGRELLKRSRFLLSEAAALEKLARVVRDGVKPEIRLAVVHGFPTRLLIPALRRFSSQHGNAQVRLTEASAAEIRRMLHNDEADITISNVVPQGFLGNVLTQIEYVPVAHPAHPLFKLDRELGADDLSGEIQIISPAEHMVHNVDLAGSLPTAQKHWYVSNFETAISAICEGIGYGWVAINRISDSLKNGKLKILPLQPNSTYIQKFFLIRANHSGQSNDTDELTKLLHEAAESVSEGKN